MTSRAALSPKRVRHRSDNRRARPMRWTRSRSARDRRCRRCPRGGRGHAPRPRRARIPSASSGSCRSTPASTLEKGCCPSAPAWNTAASNADARSLQWAASPRSAPGLAARTIDSATRTASSQVAAGPSGDHPTRSTPGMSGTEPLGSYSITGPSRAAGSPRAGEDVCLRRGGYHRPAGGDDVGHHDCGRLSRTRWSEYKDTVFWKGELRCARRGERTAEIDPVTIELRSSQQETKRIAVRIGHHASPSRTDYRPTSWRTGGSVDAHRPRERGQWQSSAVVSVRNGRPPPGKFADTTQSDPRHVRPCRHPPCPRQEQRDFRRFGTRDDARRENLWKAAPSASLAP